MKLSALITTFALAATTTSKPTPKNDFCSLRLPGGHWSADEKLFHSTLKGYNAKYTKYTKESWSDFMLNKCRHQSACTSTEGYAANNSGSTGGYFWFGYTYSGGPVTLKNYTRDKTVNDATAWTISSDGCAN